MYIHAAQKQSRQISRAGKALVVIAALGLMASCGKKEGQPESKATQTIARVNGDEITVHQVNGELQRANVRPEQQEAAAKQIVQGLIDRQILMQEALNNKVDRNPQVLQALENARAQILAQAYLEEMVSQVAKPTPAEIADYRNSHQEIFANRKVYLMDELTLAPEGYSEELAKFTDSAKTIEEVTAWLEQHQVKFRRGKAAHAAETLPKPLLDQLSKMKVGDIIFVRAKEGNMISRIMDVKEASISEKDSTPLIERILTTEKRKAAAEAKMKALRESAKVVYLDKKFSPAGPGDKADAPAKVEVAPAPQAKPEAPAAAEKEEKPAAANIEKGISGL